MTLREKGQAPQVLELVLAADLHFGDYPQYPDMLRHIQDAFRDVVDDAVNRCAPIFLLGDTFDPLHGSIAAKVLDPICNLFQEVGQKVPIHIIRGNHGRGALGTGDHLETPLGLIENITLYAEPTIVTTSYFALGLIPYQDDAGTFMEMVRRISEDMKIDAGNRFRFLLTHQAYKGGYVGPDEPGYQPGEEQGAFVLPINLFNDVDHVFSGHYHKHQTIQHGNTPITYVGSLLQNNFGDAGQIRGHMVVHLDQEGQLGLLHVPSHARYPVFKRPKITVDDIPDLENTDLSNVYFQPIVVDPRVTSQDLGKIQAYKMFPPLWQITDTSETRLDVTAQSTPEEILAEYIEALCKNFPTAHRDRLFTVGLDLYYASPRKESVGGTQGAIELESLEMQNFRRVSKETFTFPKKGAWVFVGPNGAGKSTPLMAIIWGLFGELPGTAESPINRQAGKGCMVRVTLSCAGTLYTVMRFRQHSKYKNKVLFFRGDTIPPTKSPSNLTQATNALTQKAILQTLGLDSDIFQSIICIRKLFKLASAEVKDGDKREFLDKAFGLEEWEAPYDETLLRLRKQKDGSIELDKSLATKEAIAEKAAITLADYRVRSQEWDRERRKDIATADMEVRRIQTRLEVHQRQTSADPETIQRTLQDKEDQLEEMPRDGEPERKKYTAGRIQIVESLGAAKSQKALIAQRIERLEREKKFNLPLAGVDSSSTCPTCSQPISEKHIKACQKAFIETRDTELEELRKESAAVDKRLKELTQLKEGLDGRLSRIDGNIERKRLLKEEIAVLQEKLTSHQREHTQHRNTTDKILQEQKAAEKRRDALQCSKDPYASLMVKAEEEIASLKAEIKELNVDVRAAMQMTEDLKFWERGYSKSGIRSYLLDSYLPRLTEFIQRQLDTLSNGAIRFRLGANKLNKDGTFQSRLDISITNIYGGESYEEQSGGEAHRIDIAIAMGVNAYSRLVRRHSVNALFLDDVADCFIDETGADALARLIRGFSGNVWVGLITHKPVLAARFDHQVKVVRGKDSFSTYKFNS